MLMNNFYSIKQNWMSEKCPINWEFRMQNALTGSYIEDEFARLWFYQLPSGCSIRGHRGTVAYSKKQEEYIFYGI